MLNIQSFLRTQPNTDQALRALDRQHRIVYRRHPTYPNLILFKYAKHDDTVDFSNPMVCECRGIILDEEAYWSIVSYPFNKFHNDSSPLAAAIDWNTAKVQEKVDGSIITLYKYNNQWEVSTSSTPSGLTVVGNFGFTFKDLFWKTLAQYNIEAPIVPGETYSVMLELTSQYNKVVVHQPAPKLTVIGGRRIDNALQQYPELSPEEINQIVFAGKLPVVKSFPNLKDYQSILKTNETLDPLLQEGFVVCDANYNRVKVKSKAYFDLHLLSDNLTSDRTLVEIVRMGTDLHSTTAAFPEYKEKFDTIKLRLTELENELTAQYEEWKGIESQKDFALLAIKSRCSAALFQLRNGSVDSIREYLNTMHHDHLLEVLGVSFNRGNAKAKEE